MDLNQPGLSDRVQAVQERLEKAVARAGLRDDPYGDLIAAQSEMLDVLVLAAMEVKQAKQPEFTATQIDTLGRKLAAGCSAWAGHMRTAFERRTAAAVAIGMFVMLLIGMALDHWGIDGDMRGMTCGYAQTGQWACWAPLPPKSSGAHG